MLHLRNAVFAALLISFAPLSAQTETGFQVHLLKTGVLAEVTINGYPLLEWNDSNDLSMVYNAGLWIYPGKNVLEARLTNPVEPKGETNVSRAFTLEAFFQPPEEIADDTPRSVRIYLPVTNSGVFTNTNIAYNTNFVTNTVEIPQTNVLTNTLPYFTTNWSILVLTNTRTNSIPLAFTNTLVFNFAVTNTWSNALTNPAPDTNGDSNAASVVVAVSNSIVVSNTNLTVISNAFSNAAFTEVRTNRVLGGISTNYTTNFLTNFTTNAIMTLATNVTTYTNVTFKTPGPYFPLPFRNRVEFLIRMTNADSLWEEAAELQLSDEVRDKAKNLLLTLHSAARTKNTGAWLSIVDYRTRSQAKAAGVEYQEYRDAVEISLRRLWDDPVFQLKPFPPADKLEYRLACGGKILLVRGFSVSPYLPDTICLSMVKGRLVVSR